MIHGQPSFISETLERLSQADVSAFLGRSRRLVVTGCGTSFHAALYGAERLHAVLAPATSVEATHAYDLAYGPFAPPPGASVLGVSHSGSTPTTNRALVRARKSGHRTLAICGLPNSEMEDIARFIRDAAKGKDVKAQVEEFKSHLPAPAFTFD